MSDPERLIVILGPTASGKSALAISLARELGGEIVGCDSTQVYRHFDIGTAKVSHAEQHGIPHHLVDLLEPDAVFTAGEYRLRALAVLDELRLRRKLPILTAGTGLYLRALLEGLSDAPARSEELRERFRQMASRRGSPYLHRLLTRLDPAAAGRIEAPDTHKVIRAIEMRVLTGKPVAEIHGAGRNRLQGYNVTKIGLLPERAALYARIDARVRHMMQAGWPDEVRKLIAAGIPADTKPFQFIGYAVLRRHLEGQLSENDTVLLTQQATRQFAKRQMTWFRRESGVHWLSGFGDDPQMISAAIEITRTGVAPKEKQPR
jgi:tRNA dimethylallyltransferase